MLGLTVSLRKNNPHLFKNFNTRTFLRTMYFCWPAKQLFSPDRCRRRPGGVRRLPRDGWGGGRDQREGRHLRVLRVRLRRIRHARRRRMLAGRRGETPTVPTPSVQGFSTLFPCAYQGIPWPSRGGGDTLFIIRMIVPTHRLRSSGLVIFCASTVQYLELWYVLQSAASSSLYQHSPLHVVFFFFQVVQMAKEVVLFDCLGLSGSGGEPPCGPNSEGQ